MQPLRLIAGEFETAYALLKKYAVKTFKFMS